MQVQQDLFKDEECVSCFENMQYLSNYRLQMDACYAAFRNVQNFVRGAGKPLIHNEQL